MRDGKGKAIFAHAIVPTPTASLPPPPPPLSAQSPNSFGVLSFSFSFVALGERVPRDSSERLGEAITFTD